MKFVRGLSADMDDLLTENGRKGAEDFFDFLCWSVAEERFESFPEAWAPTKGIVATVLKKEESEKPGGVVIVTDRSGENAALTAMIDRFCAVLPFKTRVIELQEYPFKGGCLGCFNCAVSGDCVYTDGFDSFLRNEIQTAQAIVYAFTIKDYSMGARFKGNADALPKAVG